MIQVMYQGTPRAALRGNVERQDQVLAEDDGGSRQPERHDSREDDGDAVHEKNPIRRPLIATLVQSPIETSATTLLMPPPNRPSGA